MTLVTSRCVVGNPLTVAIVTDDVTLQEDQINVNKEQCGGGGRHTEKMTIGVTSSAA